MKRMSPSLEDYLEAVFKLTGDDAGVRTTDIAAELGVSKASVNQAVGVLSHRGYVRQERYGPIYLTEDGKAGVPSTNATRPSKHSSSPFLVLMNTPPKKMHVVLSM